jgi:ribosomal protein S8
MNKQSVIIYNFGILFNILNEVKENLKFNLIKIDKETEVLDIDENKYENYLILTNESKNLSNKKININKFLFLDNLPIKIEKLFDLLNINLLKQKYNNQSEIALNRYNIDLNSRKIFNKEKSLKLTEKEIEIILFLNSQGKSKNIQDLQKEVWGYISDLETHTVETHIYRLRKKIKENFNDEKFIISSKEGYNLNE